MTELNLNFRQAKENDMNQIWEIIDFAIQSRKKDNSSQWQDGYPNADIIKNDIANQYGYVLTEDEDILFYAALIFEKEPAYEAMESDWLTNNPYAVVHRLAASPKATGKGLSHLMMDFLEEKAKHKNYLSMRIDTNYDNLAMLKILEKRDYVYCGEVYFRGSARKAFEKILISK